VIVSGDVGRVQLVEEFRVLRKDGDGECHGLL
jgi:hypothetical protein